ncbi:MAG: rod shape-determining protein [Eubacteriales bacterium]|jgi:rod shape-determining protein MreB
MALSAIYGMDLGSDSVKIYDEKNNSIKKEVNMAAVRDKRTLIAVGNDAYEMYEKTPQNVETIRPIERGRIQNALMMEAVLHTLLGRYGEYHGFHPLLYFSVPTDMTEIERRTYTTIARKGKFRNARIFLVEKPIADALAMGVPILSTSGAVLVNIGYESTALSVIVNRQVIISQVIPIGGHLFTSEIVEGIRKKNSFSVSEHTAERLKITLCRLDEDRGEGCKVGGIDIDSGLPRNGVVSSANVISCVRKRTDELCNQLRKVMQRIPPHIREIVAVDGIHVSGGSSRIPGMGEYMSERIGFPVSVSEYHELSTVCGLKAVITNEEYRHLAYPSVKSLY